MKKLVTVLGVIAVLSTAVAFLSKANTAEDDAGTANKKSDKEIINTLTSGKWVNKSGGYKLSEDKDRTVERYKTLEFKEDSTFTLDSVKQSFLGEWHIIDDNTIQLTFNNYASEEKILDKIAILRDEGTLKIGKFTYDNKSGAISGLLNFYEFSGFSNVTGGHLIMIIIGIVFIFLAIRYEYEPLLLIPIGTGILIGNIPFFQAVGFNLKLGIYEDGSVLNYLYFGLRSGIYPPLVFLGIGAMTDFSSLISKPKLMALGAAAQIGIFATFLGALYLGFAPAEAGAIGIIGGADGPTAIFLSSKLADGTNVIGHTAAGAPIHAQNLIGPIAIAAYSYMALVPVIQPPLMRLMTTKKERKWKMKPPRAVSKTEKIIFPIAGLLITGYLAPSALPLLGMLFFGNILKESGVSRRLADTASNSLVDIVTILLGLTVGASTQADVFLTTESIMIFGLGALSFMVATLGGLTFARIMNMFLKDDEKINPLIGASGVSAVPDSARVVQMEGLKADPNNHLLMHAMAPNVSGVIGSAVGAGILLSFLL